MNHYEFTKSFLSVSAALQAESGVKKVLLENNMPKARSTVTRDGNTIKFQVNGNISAVMLTQVLDSNWIVAQVGFQ